jgi:hypothetical protein
MGGRGGGLHPGACVAACAAAPGRAMGRDENIHAAGRLPLQRAQIGAYNALLAPFSGGALCSVRSHPATLPLHGGPRPCARSRTWSLALPWALPRAPLRSCELGSRHGSPPPPTHTADRPAEDAHRVEPHHGVVGPPGCRGCGCGLGRWRGGPGRVHHGSGRRRRERVPARLRPVRHPRSGCCQRCWALGGRHAKAPGEACRNAWDWWGGGEARGHSCVARRLIALNPRAQVLFVLGGPGAGKGTQCAR